MYAELGAKALVIAGQLMAKRFEGAASQAVSYFASGSSPMALEIPVTIIPMTIGVV
jgi:hypothetical protein